jgi:[CysO sulfur-carrier protein]-S-L-cysteine hydrolase
MHIAASVVGEIIEHARREAPSECCGLLVGQDESIERAVPTRNAAASRSRYLVDASEHFALIRELRGTGREIVGAYHSHPASAAIPSPTDIAEAWSADFVYVIVSLEEEARPDVRAFRIAQEKYVTVELTTERRP